MSEFLFVLLSAVLAGIVGYAITRLFSSRVSSAANQGRKAKKTAFERPKAVELSSKCRDLLTLLDLSRERTIVTISIPNNEQIDEGNRMLKDIITELASAVVVILIQRAASDEDEKNGRESAQRCFQDSIPDHRVLFYEKLAGIIAILRQVQPSLHIETDPSIRDKAAQYVRMTFIPVDENVEGKKDISRLTNNDMTLVQLKDWHATYQIQ
jgi:hypothetical protein